MDVANGEPTTLLDKVTLAVNRIGFPAVVVGYFLYKDWVFTNNLVANQVQIILTQTQIANAVEKLASAMVK